MIEDFEIVTDWTYSEIEGSGGTCTGAQDTVWKTEGANSYKLVVSVIQIYPFSSYAYLKSNSAYNFSGHTQLFVDVKYTIDKYTDSYGGSVNLQISENGTDWTTLKSVGSGNAVEETWKIDITNYQNSYYIRFMAHKHGPNSTTFNFDYLSFTDNLRELKEDIYCTDELEPIYSLDSANFSPLTSFRTEKSKNIITLSLPRKGEYILQRTGDEARIFDFSGYLLSTKTNPTLRDTKKAKLEKALSTDAIVKFTILGEGTFYGKITSLSITDVGGDPLAYIFRMEGMEVIV